MRHFFFVSFSLFTCWHVVAQEFSFCEELSSTKLLVNSAHYSPRPINDSLSKGVWDLFLKQLDKHQRFFIQDDIARFKNDEYNIDDYLQRSTCDFISKYTEVLALRIKETKTYITKLSEVNLDYTGKDSLYYREKGEIVYFKSKEAAKNYWNKRVRYEILNKLIETDSSISYISKNFKRLEKAIKPKVISNEICLLEELEHIKGHIKHYVETAFLDAYLKYQDPNSAYFSSSDKQLFEQSVANSQSTFGISTEKKSNGDIIIAHITPGSSAFKNGGFEVNDVILSLQNSEETLETYCTSNTTITSFINDTGQNEITFRLKKKNGKIIAITLQKSQTAIEQNSITGFILEADKTIGYISIPSFYTDMESLYGLGVANDVAKQIYKLQREGIEGLIIDLRFNGGGSMKEAAELSGMFIDRGPVAISKVGSEEPYTIRDPNRGSIFNKPIAVLINQFSASASEFLAAALQDYKRAIIIGTTSHGKATSQRIVPLNDEANSNFIKLTMGQFFRVTGESLQKIGVEPDIVLPSIYDGYETQERFKPSVISSSTVKVTLAHKPKQDVDFGKLSAESQSRIKDNGIFKKIKDFNTILVDQYLDRTGVYPLTLDWLYRDYKHYFDSWKAYEMALDNNMPIFNVSNTTSTNQILSYNSEDKNLNIKQRDKLSKDPYIQEAYAILLSQI